MTQEDRQLLLKDLCERVPYGVKINENTQGDFTVIGLTTERVFTTCETEGCHNDFPIECVKPYLFPLSSMTEEQLYEIKEITEFKYNHNTLELVKWTETHTTLEFWLEEVPQYSVIEVFDWLNKHHFDYRGLIEKGLAIDATGLNIYC